MQMAITRFAIMTTLYFRLTNNDNLIAPACQDGVHTGDRMANSGGSRETLTLAAKSEMIAVNDMDFTLSLEQQAVQEKARHLAREVY